VIARLLDSFNEHRPLPTEQSYAVTLPSSRSVRVYAITACPPVGFGATTTSPGAAERADRLNARSAPYTSSSNPFPLLS
jgi:hypothetical protein